jgi:hypothetical protein
MVWNAIRNSDSLTTLSPKGLAKKFPALLKIYVFSYSPLLTTLVLLSSRFQFLSFSSSSLSPAAAALLKISAFVGLPGGQDKFSTGQNFSLVLVSSRFEFFLSSIFVHFLCFVFVFLGLFSFWFPCAICMFLLLLVV